MCLSNPLLTHQMFYWAERSGARFATPVSSVKIPKRELGFSVDITISVSLREPFRKWERIWSHFMWVFYAIGSCSKLANMSAYEKHGTTIIELFCFFFSLGHTKNAFSGINCTFERYRRKSALKLFSYIVVDLVWLTSRWVQNQSRSVSQWQKNISLAFSSKHFEKADLDIFRKFFIAHNILWVSVWEGSFKALVWAVNLKCLFISHISSFSWLIWTSAAFNEVVKSSKAFGSGSASS